MFITRPLIEELMFKVKIRKEIKGFFAFISYG